MFSINVAVNVVVNGEDKKDAKGKPGQFQPHRRGQGQRHLPPSKQPMTTYIKTDQARQTTSWGKPLNWSIGAGIPGFGGSSKKKAKMPRNPYNIPTIWQQLSNPIKLLARITEFNFSLLRSDRSIKRNITLVSISDTHCLIPPFVSYGDILIHAGDLTDAGTPAELQEQIDWLASLPHRYKIVIAGNHDTFLDPKSRQTLSQADQEGQLDWKDIIYLQDSSTTLSFPDRTSPSLKIYGSPHTPDLLGPEHAFQHYPRGTDIWGGTIPLDADVVITHGPPKYHLDLPGVTAMGDEDLLREIRRVRPAVHVFG